MPERACPPKELSNWTANTPEGLATKDRKQIGRNHNGDNMLMEIAATEDEFLHSSRFRPILFLGLVLELGIIVFEQLGYYPFEPGPLLDLALNPTYLLHFQLSIPCLESIVYTNVCAPDDFTTTQWLPFVTRASTSGCLRFCAK
jgi:hypothetical protein